MIDEYAKDIAISDRLAVIPIAVDDEPTTWVATIKAICPSFTDVYTRNPWVQTHFEYWGIKNSESLLAGHFISGSEVRSKIASGGDWRKFVPSAVAAILESIDGLYRIRTLLQGNNHRITDER
jgi:nicotinamide-nucleotide adenylyltransferase